jgi:CDP-glucose 4,6-dehydratase
METYGGKRVLVTGHSGFKGSWASVLLERLGAHVFGASIDVPPDVRHVYHEYSVGSRLRLGESRNFDVSDRQQVQGLLQADKYDFIFHFAAQAIVSSSIEDPIRTFETNVLGLGNILHFSRIHQPGATVILVTSDKCYEPDPQALPYVESHVMGGDDPYSGSKAAAEILYSSFIRTYKASSWPSGVGTVRAGNVFGGGDWSPNRLAPDLVRDALAGKPTTLRLPYATRPWTYVLDLISGYLMLGQKLRAGEVSSVESWNFASGEKLTVREFAQLLSSDIGGQVSSNAREEFEEVGFLELDASKARRELGWNPLFGLEEALKLTSRWYADPSTRKDELHFLAPYLQVLQLGTSR